MYSPASDCYGTWITICNATTNDIVAISRPFRSRFIEFNLPPYSYEEFCEIAVKLADKEMDMIGKLL
jgi:hypothetical protein